MLSDRLDPSALSDAERAVLDRISGEGLHVVQLWAPWCSNSIAPLERGWSGLVERQPEVAFTFVTVWNGGASGAEELARLGLAERVTEVTAPETGTREDKPGRQRHFLGLPLTWIPTTWVFRPGGELAFAFHYGETEAEDVERALAAARQTW
jgi:hypothetical protein